MKLTTTLNIIRSHGPCQSSWKKALKLLGKAGPDDEDLSLEWVLDNLGLEDALWGLRAVRGRDEADRDRLARLFACDCVERVLPVFEKEFPEDKRPHEAIDVARRYADGKATEKELSVARAAAKAAAWDAAKAAAWDAAKAAADAAAWAAAKAAAWDAAKAAADAAAWAAAKAAADAAAWAAAWDAAKAAADAAAWAAAWDAAWDAAGAAEQKEQAKLFKKYFCTEGGQ